MYTPITKYYSYKALIAGSGNINWRRSTTCVNANGLKPENSNREMEKEDVKKHVEVENLKNKAIMIFSKVCLSYYHLNYVCRSYLSHHQLQ